MSRISIDVQPLLGNKCGIGQYIWNMVHGLAKVDTKNSYYLSFFDTKFRSGKVPVPGVNFFKSRSFIPPRLMRKIWLSYDWPNYDFFFGKRDLYHFANFIIPPMMSGRTIATIHDLSFMRFPEFTLPRTLGYLRRNIESTLNSADAILVDSHFTREELVHFFKVPEQKVHVVHLAMGDSFKPQAVPIKKQILFVGTLEPRKNLPVLFKAFELFLNRMKDAEFRLVIAGMKGWLCDEIYQSLEKNVYKDKIILSDFVPDEALPQLYAESAVFVYPSLYEGFGIPILEAMASGTPVIASRTASLPEIGGDAAFWIDPKDAEGLANAIQRVVNDQELRKNLIHKGREQAEKFSWEKTARETLDVYQKVLI